MSARSAQRTRWRRWRMGWDIAGRKDRDGRRVDTSCRAAEASPWPCSSSPSSFMPSKKRSARGASKKRNARGARDRSTTCVHSSSVSIFPTGYIPTHSPTSPTSTLRAARAHDADLLI